MASAVCLINGTTPGARQNLATWIRQWPVMGSHGIEVNQLGESYPLPRPYWKQRRHQAISSMILWGIYISNYPASEAANRLAGVIIEEPKN